MKLNEVKIGMTLVCNTNNHIVEVVKILPKEFLKPQEIRCKCLKSSPLVKEDVGMVFDYELNSLEKTSVVVITQSIKDFK